MDLLRKNIPLFKVAMHSQIGPAITETLHSGFIGEGPKVAKFEKTLAFRFNNPHCLTLNSGTAGLRLSLELIRHKSRGKVRGKVLTTPLTCFATVAPVLTSGHDIVWADIQKDSLNIDPDSIREKIDDSIDAIIVVHWGGYPCDMDEIYEISKEYRIPIIEDGAHTFGATYHNSTIGDCSFSDFCMISFQAIKHLTTGDGGVLFLRNHEDYKLGKLLRWFGISREGPFRDLRCSENIQKAGFKFQMNDIAATIGLLNLDLVTQNLLIAEHNTAAYRDKLKDVPGITLLQNKMDRNSSNWLFTILVEDPVGFSRKMGEKGIMVSKVHSRLDHHSCVEKYRTDLPVLEELDNKRICIPCGFWVKKEEREYIINSIKEGW